MTRYAGAPGRFPRPIDRGSRADNYLYRTIFCQQRARIAASWEKIAGKTDRLLTDFLRAGGQLDDEIEHQCQPADLGPGRFGQRSRALARLV